MTSQRLQISLCSGATEEKERLWDKRSDTKDEAESRSALFLTEEPSGASTRTMSWRLVQLQCWM